MIRVALSRGYVSLIDEADASLVLSRSWRVVFKNSRPYARSNSVQKTPEITMHRLILDPPNDIEVDHINGDSLDNRRSNLRLATRQQNMRNTRKRDSCSSKYKGVYWMKSKEKWYARIIVDGKSKSLGLHSIEEDAALAYDCAARVLFGDFARPNFQLKGNS